MTDATHRPTRTNATQKEKAEILRNDQLVASTFLSHTHNNDEGGRYAKPMNVIGSTPTVDYPRLPSGPWADPVQVPPEEPLGFSVEDHEPVGTIQEIQASLDGTTNTVADVAASPCGEVVVSSSPEELGEQLPAHAQGGAAVVSTPSAAVEALSEFSCFSSDVEPPAATPNPKPRRGI
jgi:hypothetical protein